MAYDLNSKNGISNAIDDLMKGQPKQTFTSTELLVIANVVKFSKS